MNTLLLHPTSWDLLLDANHNIAMATEPYALTQDVASACKLEQGELWYNKDVGIPYLENILGYRPSLSQLKKWYQDAALSVPGVVSASVNITAYQDRELTGQLNFTDQNGITNGVTL